MTNALRFRLNGVDTLFEGLPDQRLIDILRDELGHMAAKKACAIGRCGSCMVLLDGQPANACLIMAWQLHGREIITPEGLPDLPEGRIVQQGLTEENAFQCGYCAPGFTVTLTALLCDTPNPDDDTLREALSGNICRCTGYHSIMRGARRAVEILAQSREAK